MYLLSEQYHLLSAGTGFLGRALLQPYRAANEETGVVVLLQQFLEEFHVPWHCLVEQLLVQLSLHAHSN